MAGCSEAGSPGSASRSTMGKSLAARVTPRNAAELNERSSLPPLSKTIPTRIFFGSPAAFARLLHPDPARPAIRARQRPRVQGAFCRSMFAREGIPVGLLLANTSLQGDQNERRRDL